MARTTTSYLAAQTQRARRVFEGFSLTEEEGFIKVNLYYNHPTRGPTVARYVPTGDPRAPENIQAYLAIQWARKQTLPRADEELPGYEE
jgi:hypothetical protein